MKTQSAVVLLAVLCILGCVEPQVTSNDGLSISFYAEPEVYGNGNERVEAFLDVQNIGDSVATNVKAELFNYGDLTGTLSTDLGTLEARGKDYPGEAQDYSFLLNVPELGIGLKDTIELGVRVYYDYSTFGKADIPVIPKEDVKTKEETGIKFQLDKSYSSGPIAIEILSSKNPVVVSEEYSTFGIRIVIDNIGSGRVVDDTLTSAVLEVPDGIKLAEPRLCDFEGTLSSSNRALTLTDNEKLKLVQGKRKTLICRFDVTDIDLENTYGFQTTLTYRYGVDAFTPITIIGTSTG